MAEEKMRIEHHNGGNPNLWARNNFKFGGDLEEVQRGPRLIPTYNGQSTIKSNYAMSLHTEIIPLADAERWIASKLPKIPQRPSRLVRRSSPSRAPLPPSTRSNDLSEPPPARALLPPSNRSNDLSEPPPARTHLPSSTRSKDLSDPQPSSNRVVSLGHCPRSIGVALTSLTGCPFQFDCSGSASQVCRRCRSEQARHCHGMPIHLTYAS